MAYELSPLRETDAETLGPLHNRIWREAYAGLLPADVLDSRDDSESTARWRMRALAHERLGTSPEGCTTWVARDEDGVAIGWIGVAAARDDDAPAPTELWSLYVAPEHQGRGAAQVLTDAMLPDGPAYLWVLEGNERAIAFYRKLGFETDGATKELGDSGAFELRMSRT
ncbi:GCN5 family acetyltransferase [Intrasporangium oryzae NRRL B-24470]|uniref:GCN5 family acetyltransferase n=1 Tax=Intrasporangium oryzae NRRL B-24470 TaxID=1386089 RepID=W9G7R6_9MICO|nr:GNAT family N-acetyltransferase [Intrasporangium oryzae]EWT01322.1 GCN5 family acetyltransferase [Intrasporangium oryzae NRRL B-24470]